MRLLIDDMEISATPNGQGKVLSIPAEVLAPAGFGRPSAHTLKTVEVTLYPKLDGALSGWMEIKDRG